MSSSEDNILLSRSRRMTLFVSLCLLRGFLLINVSALSAAVSTIKSSLQLTDKEFSLFSTTMGIGKICSSLGFIWLINVPNRKYVLITVLSIHSICLALFAYIDNFAILLLLRSINGFCLVFWIVYFPLWIDQYGIQKWKSWMMTIMSLNGIIGLVWGYLLHLIFDVTQWKLIFLLEAIIVASYAIGYLFVPDNYFNKSVFFTQHEQLRDENDISLRVVSIFLSVEKKSLTNSANANTDCDSPDHKLLKKDKTPKICTALFFFLTMSKSFQYFIGAAIGFWYSDYCQTSLMITDSKLIMMSYTIIWVIAPIIGQIAGGFISTFIGGYESKNALVISAILQWLSIPLGLFVPFMNSLAYFTGFMGFFNVMDFSSATITNPLLLASVDKELRGKAIGIFSLTTSVFGILPAAYVYGFLKNHFQYLSNKAGMYFIMIIPLLTGVLLMMAVITQLNERRSKEKGSHAFNDKNDKDIVLVDIKK